MNNMKTVIPGKPFKTTPAQQRQVVMTRNNAQPRILVSDDLVSRIFSAMAWNG